MSVPELTTAKEFRDYLSRIPEENWITGGLWEDGKMCAMGHVGGDADSYRRDEICGNIRRLGEIIKSRYPNDSIEGHAIELSYLIFSLNDGHYGPLSRAVCVEAHKRYSPKANFMAALDAIISSTPSNGGQAG